jgi:hypothetical protein
VARLYLLPDDRILVLTIGARVSSDAVEEYIKPCFLGLPGAAALVVKSNQEEFRVRPSCGGRVAVLKAHPMGGKTRGVTARWVVNDEGNCSLASETQQTRLLLHTKGTNYSTPQTAKERGSRVTRSSAFSVECAPKVHARAQIPAAEGPVQLLGPSPKRAPMTTDHTTPPPNRCAIQPSCATLSHDPTLLHNPTLLSARSSPPV